ncbi:E3 Ubiquitin ligase [Halalkaliarchaeum desulfuricum]|uniref:E3 Ubiquitin ligase n=1 Tax=Halalkaliarchaeum desulfuricum TaxID=2055893 RepID=A0A343TJM9_9EURY|nr:hypothetical protein [Halalkaliarchaeum desulfuricum]AUX09301.1 E3 Ubiquitin ligase [Halalkaliarchaeum desulfuricum]
MLYTIVGLGFIAIGFAIGWYGVRPLMVVPSVLRATVQAPSEVTESDSFVVCQGIANKSSETITAPFTGMRCLGFEFEVTERQAFGVGVPWFQVHLDDGVATHPFTLDDPAGGLIVVPSSKRFVLDTESTVFTVDATESLPERIQRFVDVRDGLEPVAGWVRAVPGLGARRYIERRIDPGEEYLIAGVTKRQQNEIVLTDNLVITDRSPRWFALARLRRATFPTVIALVLVVAGLGGIVL